MPSGACRRRQVGAQDDAERLSTRVISEQVVDEFESVLPVDFGNEGQLSKPSDVSAPAASRARSRGTVISVYPWRHCHDESGIDSSTR